MSGTVLEEGLRGVGGYLFNGRRERFMERDPPFAWSALRATSCPGARISKSWLAAAAHAVGSTSTCHTSAPTSLSKIFGGWSSAVAMSDSTSPMSQWRLAGIGLIVFLYFALRYA
jgi:hypothetical protein